MNNSVSFTGSLRLRDYSKGIDRTFKTTEAQDRLMKEAADRLAPMEDLTVLSKKQVQEFHKLMEKITGLEITNIDNEKGFYHTPDNIAYVDRFIRPWAGIHVDINI